MALTMNIPTGHPGPRLVVRLSALLGCMATLACNPQWPYQPTQFIVPEPRPAAGGFVDPDSLQAFIGSGQQAIVVYTLQLNNGGRTIYYANLSLPGATPRRMAKPAERSDWDADSPLLSPDGRLCTYYLVNPLNASDCAVYAQPLDSAAQPRLIAYPASEPHFFADSTGLSVIYTDTAGKIDDAVELITGHATWARTVDAHSGEPQGAARQIAPYIMYGGLSAGGRYLCTAYSNACFYDRQLDKLIQINSGRQTCNASVSPDPGNPGRMLFLNINGVQNMLDNPFGTTAISQHRAIFLVNTANTVEAAFDITTMLDYPSQAEWQDPEWSNHADYFCTLASPGDGAWDCYAVRISDRTPLRLNNPALIRLDETSTPYLHIVKGTL